MAMDVQSSTSLSERQSLLSHPEQIYFILGFPQGEPTLLDILEHTQGGLILWEPDSTALSSNSALIEEALKEGRLKVFADLDEAFAFLRKAVTLPHRLGWIQPNSVEASRLRNFVPDFELQQLQIHNSIDIEFETAQVFHQLWFHNFARNLPALALSHPMQTLKDVAKGYPAIVISRGPSLDKAIDDIKALRSHCVLIAIGGALRHLEKAGIVPDFALFYDARGMKEQLHGVSLDYLSKIRFVHSPGSECEAFTAPSIQRYHFWIPYFTTLAGWFEREFHQAQPILSRGGGSVSLLAFQLAVLLGCREIALIGQDLAFPNNQVYAGGQEVIVNDNGMLDIPATDTLISRPMTMATVMGQEGQPLPTLQSYLGFVRQFESMAQDLEKSCHLYNASLGGAHLEGFELSALGELGKKWLAVEKPSLSKGELWKKRELELSISPDAGVYAIKSFQLLLTHIEEGLKLCHTIGKTVNNARKPNPEELNKSLVKLQTWLDDPKHILLKVLCVYPVLAFRQPNQMTTPLLSRTQKMIQEIHEVLKTAENQFSA
jgi:hypothetical protein